MALIGAKNPDFAPLEGDGTEETPYVYGKRLRIGRMVKADETPSFAEGELYADNVLAEHAKEFVSAAIAMETDDISDEVAAKVYGMTVEEKTVIYNAEDAPPLGALGFIRTGSRNKIKYFQGVFYPRAQASLGATNSASKTNSITFSTANTDFTIFAVDETGNWKFTATYPTEEEANEWLDAQFVSTPVAPVTRMMTSSAKTAVDKRDSII